MTAGEKLKLSILTSAFAGATGAADTPGVTPTTTNISRVAKRGIQWAALRLLILIVSAPLTDLLHAYFPELSGPGFIPFGQRE
jgi:hypothetical protein